MSAATNPKATAAIRYLEMRFWFRAKRSTSSLKSTGIPNRNLSSMITLIIKNGQSRGSLVKSNRFEGNRTDTAIDRQSNGTVLGYRNPRNSLISNLADGSESTRLQPLMVPKTRPISVGFTVLKPNQLFNWHSRPALGYHASSFEFTLQKNRLPGRNALCVFASAERTFATKHVKSFGIEIQACDAVAVLQRVVSCIRIGIKRGRAQLQDRSPASSGTWNLISEANSRLSLTSNDGDRCKDTGLISYTLERPKTLSKSNILFKLTFKACTLRRKVRFLIQYF